MAISKNTSSEPGDIITIRASVVIDGIVELSSYVTDVDNETGDRYFDKEFRYSIDQGHTYTDWAELTNPNIDAIEVHAEKGILIEYRYTRAGADATDTIAFNSVTLLGNFRRSFINPIKNLHFRFYPKGRAFNMPEGSTFKKINAALAASEDRALVAAHEILNQILPDNQQFSEDDALAWENRLGLAVNTSLTLEVRKTAILRKMQFPGTVKARQSFLYMQKQLQLAGFDVYLHENRFPAGGGNYQSMPYTAFAGVSGNAVHSPLVQHGQVNHGEGSAKVVANSVDAEEDQGFNINANLERTFFIGGQVPGSFVNIPASREVEFRQMILRLKPVHTIAYILVNYV